MAKKSPTKEELEAQNELIQGSNEIADKLAIREQGDQLPAIPENSVEEWEMLENGTLKFFNMENDGDTFEGIYLGKPENDKLRGFQFMFTGSHEIADPDGEVIQRGDIVLLPNFYALQKHFDKIEPSQEYIYRISRLSMDEIGGGRKLARLSIMRGKVQR